MRWRQCSQILILLGKTLPRAVILSAAKNQVAHGPVPDASLREE